MNIRVKFEINYFGPDGNRYRKGRFYEVPGEWEAKGLLPKSRRKDKEGNPVPSYVVDNAAPVEAHLPAKPPAPPKVASRGTVAA